MLSPENLLFLPGFSAEILLPSLFLLSRRNPANGSACAEFTSARSARPDTSPEPEVPLTKKSEPVPEGTNPNT